MEVHEAVASQSWKGMDVWIHEAQEHGYHSVRQRRLSAPIRSHAWQHMEGAWRLSHTMHDESIPAVLAKIKRKAPLGTVGTSASWQF